ncbi:hypothetical protein M758_2G152600 [Ceratodon purpureus]|nr:hypothetical protein M758_2G152600 [Ceratodon purpureus]
MCHLLEHFACLAEGMLLTILDKGPAGHSAYFYQIFKSKSLNSEHTSDLRH